MTRGPGMYVPNDRTADMFSRVFGMRDTLTEEKKFHVISGHSAMSLHSVSDHCAAVRCQCSSQQPRIAMPDFLICDRMASSVGIMLFLYPSSPCLSSLPPAIRLSHLAVLFLFRRDTSMTDRQRGRGIASETQRTYDALESPLSSIRS